jgi:predicted dehydrogenase
MIEAVEDAGVPFQVGFMRRYDPAYMEAKALIEAGTIGRPVTFKGIGRDPFCPRPEFADPAHSGGLIIDMGIHDMDLARWLMNAEVERVTAEGTTMVCADLKAVGDLDNAVVNLRFENGAIGNVEVSRNAFYGYDIRTEVLGSKAAVRVGGDELSPRLLLLPNGESDGGGSYLLRRFGTAYREQMHDFVSCVREDRPPRCTGTDALAAFEISLAASYAAQTGEPVTLDAVRSGWTPSANSTR